VTTYVLLDCVCVCVVFFSRRNISHVLTQMTVLILKLCHLKVKTVNYFADLKKNEGRR
jgi:hypothetical protein